MYQLSKEFQYTELEEQIMSFINNHISSKNDIETLLQTDNSLFIDQFISLQINSILENNPNHLDMISSNRLCRIIAISQFSNMPALVDYLLHRYQIHSEANQEAELELDFNFFLFVDYSTIREDQIDKLIPIFYIN